MKEIIVSVFPTYDCNQDCNFCYLKNNHDIIPLSLEKLDLRLKEISSKYKTNMLLG